jgi:hypothetical protein
MTSTSVRRSVFHEHVNKAGVKRTAHVEGDRYEPCSDGDCSDKDISLPDSDATSPGDRPSDFLLGRDARVLTCGEQLGRRRKRKQGKQKTGAGNSLVSGRMAKGRSGPIRL